MKAHGREDYSVGLLVATGVLAIVVIPTTLKTFEWITKAPLQVPVRSIVGLVFLTILAPLLIGISVRRLAPSLGGRLAKPVGVVATVLLGLAVLPILFLSAKAIPALIGNGTLVGMTVFASVGLVVGHLLGGPEPHTRRALALATACRHPGLALAAAHASFPQQKLVLPAVALYFLLISMLWAAASLWYARERTGVAGIRKEVLP